MARQYSDDELLIIRKDVANQRALNYMKREGVRKSSQAFSIIGFIFSLMLLVSVVGVLRGNNNTLTFSGILNILSSTYAIPIDWIFTLNTATSFDWGFYVGELYVSFDWLKYVYDFISPIIQLLLYLCTGISQVFLFLLQFVRILFGY